MAIFDDASSHNDEECYFLLVNIVNSYSKNNPYFKVTQKLHPQTSKVIAESFTPGSYITAYEILLKNKFVDETEENMPHHLRVIFLKPTYKGLWTIYFLSNDF
jgi:hypothetical protein